MISVMRKSIIALCGLLVSCRCSETKLWQNMPVGCRNFASQPEYSGKIDCGFPGINESKCVEDDSCMFNTFTGGPSCFFKPGIQPPQCCDVDKASRTKCEESGYDLEKEPNLCRQLGCCFSAANNAYPRCFKSPTGCCQSIISNQLIPKIDAGYSGITKEKCEELGNTCWDPVEGSVFCFYKFFYQRCSVAQKSRKQCSAAQPNTDRVSCLAAGCCYDPKPDASYKCYTGD